MICYNISQLYRVVEGYIITVRELKGPINALHRKWSRRYSYGHISCNLVMCLGIGEDTPIFVGHAYGNTVDRIRKYSDLACIKDACPEIFEAFLFARELRNSNITPYLLTVGEVTSRGKTFASLVMDRLEELLSSREFIFPIDHINPYIVNPDSDSLDITVNIDRPYLNILVDFHTPHFAVQSIPYMREI